MKIAYLANIRFPSERAHASQIANMCSSFVKLGAEVCLFANSKSAIQSDLKKLFGIKQNFTVQKVSHFKVRPGTKTSFYFSELWFALNFISKHRFKDYDFLISRSEWILALLSFFIKPEKLVWETHDGRVSKISLFIVRKKVNIVATSHSQVGLYSQYNDKILLAPNGISESFFDPVVPKKIARANLGLDENEHYTMYIGGFDSWKGVEVFFQASELSDCSRFVAIGGTLEEIERYKSQYKNVQFLGAKPYAELSEHQQAADVLVVPNTAKNDMSSKFTSPLKLFAHMSSGVPLVISNISSLTSIVDKPLVFTFEADDHSSLAEVVSGVYARYDEAVSRARELRMHSKEYTWSNRARKILSFLTKTQT